MEDYYYYKGPNYNVRRGETDWSEFTMVANDIRRQGEVYDIIPLSKPLQWSPEEEDTFWELLHGLYNDQREAISWKRIFKKVRRTSRAMVSMAILYL